MFLPDRKVLMGKKRTSKGFTLVEMLITVAIIGILATIAVPSYMHYIERGHLTLAHDELLSINNRIKTERIKNPSAYQTEADLKKLVSGFHKRAEVEEKYDIQVHAPQGTITYYLVAMPKDGSGYTKYIAMDSSGEAKKCEDSGCEKIGG